MVHTTGAVYETNGRLKAKLGPESGLVPALLLLVPPKQLQLDLLKRKLLKRKLFMNGKKLQKKFLKTVLGT